MILIGRYASPFVRRVGISMTLMGLEFEHRSISALTDGDKIRAHNPMGKVPALVLADGKVLVDSSAILDSLCETTAGQTLLPAKGMERREVLQQCAVMTNALDKAVNFVYEHMKRPPEKVHQPVVDGLIDQVTAGLVLIEKVLASGKMPAGADMNLGGITAAVGWRFLVKAMPKAADSARFPLLAAYSQACEATPAFTNCQLEV